MLVYHPAYDLNHGMFRMLRLLEKHPQKAMKWDTFRILDLYYLFPHLLGDAQWPGSMTKRKREFAKQGSKYTRVPSPKIFIQQIRGSHEAIARSLIAKGFIEPVQFNNGNLVRSPLPLPTALTDAFSSSHDQVLVDMLATEIALLPLTGTNGLKVRTGLLEHRYDAA